jgi:transcriptional regulator with XRE-family HTH domain
MPDMAQLHVRPAVLPHVTRNEHVHVEEEILALLANRAGMTQPALSRLEAGGVVPTIPLLERISMALDADLIVEIAPPRRLSLILLRRLHSNLPN